MSARSRPSGTRTTIVVPGTSAPGLVRYLTRSAIVQVRPQRLTAAEWEKSVAAPTDFTDSAALSRWGRTWTNELLDRYLNNPGALVPGTTMVVRVPEGRDRADIVAYLASLKA